MALQSVATGQYTLVATLPTGYELAGGSTSDLSVGAANNNYRGWSNLSESLGRLNNQADVTKTAQYFNASADKKEAHDQLCKLLTA